MGRGRRVGRRGKGEVRIHFRFIQAEYRHVRSGRGVVSCGMQGNCWMDLSREFSLLRIGVRLQGSRVRAIPSQYRKSQTSCWIFRR